MPENSIENFSLNADIKPNRYLSQVKLFGPEFQEKLGNVRLFLVGSGALGCEYLKNLAMLGVSCGKNGLVLIINIITRMG